MTYCMIIGEKDNYRDIAALMGKAMGYDVAVLSDAMAISLVRDRIPDVVVFNWQCITPVQLVNFDRFIRLLGNHRSKIIVSSFYKPYDVTASMVLSRADSFLKKPYAPKELMDAFSSLVSKTERVYA